MDEHAASLAYLPRAVRPGPARDGGGSRVEHVRGALLFADVSGFTRLSERLAQQGRAGAEEMVGALSTVFGPLVAEVDRRGGDVLKFGGDALFVLFRGPDPLARAAGAAAAMRRALRLVGSIPTGRGPVRLSMSQGVHHGEMLLVHAGTGGYRDVVAVGPVVSEVFALESAASAGEVLLSPAAAQGLRGTPGFALTDAGAGRGLLRSAPGGGSDGGGADSGGGRPVPVAQGVQEGGAADALARYVPEMLRGRLAQVLTESEHRTVSTAFVGFHGLDDLLAEGGADAVVRHLDSLLDTATELARRHRITVACVDAGPSGGKLMLTSGAPDGDERDAEAMLLFCSGLLAALPDHDLRAGINRGPAYAGLVGSPQRFTWSAMGDSVNVAARLAGKAARGEVLASLSVLSRAPDRFLVHQLAPLTLKGKSAPVPVALVRGSRRLAAARDGAPFVGRVQEMALLTAVADEAFDGPGALVELVGPAGVGKSRLVGQLVAARAGVRRLVLRCERQDRARPYATAVPALRPLLGLDVGASREEAGERLLATLRASLPSQLDLAPLLAVALDAEVPPTDRVDALAPEFRVPRLHDAVELLVAASVTGPVLVTVEDVGLVDDASRGVLNAALRGLGSRPWLALTTRRPGDRPLAESPEDGRDVVVGSLDEGALAALARSLVPEPVPGDDLARLVQRADGNALFLSELARGWSPDTADHLPDSVEAILAERVDRLPPPARRLLRYAAVLGEQVDLDMLTATLADAEPGSAVHEAWVAAGDGSVWRALDTVLVHEGQGRRFAHELVRRVAYDALPFSRRRELHGRAGRALERSGSDDLGLLAQHFARAGEHDRGWRYASAAAEQARERFAHGEAVELYGLALESAGSLAHVDPAAVAAVAERLGDSAETVGRYDRAERGYSAARQAAGPADAPRLLGKLGRLAERTGHYRSALRWLTRAVKAAEALPPAEARAARVELLAGRGAVRYRQGRYADCVADCTRAVAEADPGQHAAAWAHACFLLDAALTDLGRLAEATVWRERALPVFEHLGDHGRQADVLNNLGIDAYYEGRLDEAVELYQRSREARARAGDVVGGATADNNLAEVLSDQGRFDEAETVFTEALAVYSRARYPVGVALATSNLGRLRTRQGRPGEGVELLVQALGMFRDLASGALVVDTQVRLAEAVLASGDPAGAMVVVEQLASGSPELLAPYAGDLARIRTAASAPA